jgi:hypothetical protein
MVAAVGGKGERGLSKNRARHIPFVARCTTSARGPPYPFGSKMGLWLETLWQILSDPKCSVREERERRARFPRSPRAALPSISLPFVRARPTRSGPCSAASPVPATQRARHRGVRLQCVSQRRAPTPVFPHSRSPSPLGMRFRPRSSSSTGTRAAMASSSLASRSSRTASCRSTTSTGACDARRRRAAAAAGADGRADSARRGRVPSGPPPARPALPGPRTATDAAICAPVRIDGTGGLCRNLRAGRRPPEGPVARA